MFATRTGLVLSFPARDTGFPPETLMAGPWTRLTFLGGTHPGIWRHLSKKECKLSCSDDGARGGKAEAWEGITLHL